MDITTDPTEIETIIRDYSKQLYARKPVNLEEKDKFPARQTASQINKKEKREESNRWNKKQ